MSAFRLSRGAFALAGMAAFLGAGGLVRAQAPARERVAQAMRRAAEFYRNKVAVHGGYVYYCSLDLTERLGEGKAGVDEIWVQPPGTPTVGMAYLKACSATRDDFYLDAARETAEALMHGQLESGGWTNRIDFNPKGEHVARYRHGKGNDKGRNHSSLDDGVTQSALRFLMEVDQALEFKNAGIHEAAEFGRNALLAAQFPSGGFPQGWTGPAQAHPVVKASFPEYDWRTENRIKEYWELPTLNDDLAVTLSQTLTKAWEIYRDSRCRDALAKLGDFLILAQLPEPQPGWAQQYDHQMRPTWARKFEPPAVAGRETQGAIEALIAVYRVTGDAKYLTPIPKALAYLKKSLLPDGQLARFYELKTNKPLYMTKDYQLTYDDKDAPTHYGWKTESNIEDITEAYELAKANQPAKQKKPAGEKKVREIVESLDAEGRWITLNDGQGLTGQPKFKPGEKFLSSATFSKNLETLAAYMARTAKSSR